jgi:putative ABC transport system ATP-binding protein
MNTEEKTTFIFSTHDAKVMSHADRVIRLADGLISDPAAGLVGARP